MDGPCCTRKIKKHLNNEKVKRKKRIHHPKLTMKHQENSVKEWRKVVFSAEKKFNLDGPDGFQKYWCAKDFPEENYTTRHSGRGSLIVI